MSLGALGMILESMPLGLWTLAVVLLSMMVSVLSAVVGVKRGGRAALGHKAVVAGQDPSPLRCTPWPELLLTLASLAPVALMVAGVALARQAQLGALAGGIDPAKRMEAHAEGVAGEFLTLQAGSALLLLLLPLLAVAWALLLGGRRRCAGIDRAAALAKGSSAALPPAALAYLEHPGPPLWHLLLLSLGLSEGVLSPVCMMCLRVTIAMSRSFSAVAGADPARRYELLDVGLKEARQAAESFFWLGLVGLVIMAVVAWTLLGPLSADQKRRRLAPELEEAPAVSWGVTLAATCALLACAAGCLMVAWPYRQENRMPMVSRAGCKLSRTEATALPGEIWVPVHRGPDRAVAAMEVRVWQEGMALEGMALEGMALESAQQLAEELQKHRTRLRKLEQLTGGAQTFDGLARLVAHRTLPARRLLPVLAAGRRSGFHQWLLLLSETHEEVRPLLGPLRFACPTAARVLLSPAGE